MDFSSSAGIMATGAFKEHPISHCVMKPFDFQGFRLAKPLNTDDDSY
jgi:hypothetical protein